MPKLPNPNEPEPKKNITKTRKYENTKKKGRILFRVFPSLRSEKVAPAEQQRRPTAIEQVIGFSVQHFHPLTPDTLRSLQHVVR